MSCARRSRELLALRADAVRLLRPPRRDGAAPGPWWHRRARPRFDAASCARRSARPPRRRPPRVRRVQVTRCWARATACGCTSRSTIRKASPEPTSTALESAVAGARAHVGRPAARGARRRRTARSAGAMLAARWAPRLPDAYKAADAAGGRREDVPALEQLARAARHPGRRPAGRRAADARDVRTSAARRSSCRARHARARAPRPARRRGAARRGLRATTSCGSQAFGVARPGRRAAGPRRLRRPRGRGAARRGLARRGRVRPAGPARRHCRPRPPPGRRSCAPTAATASASARATPRASRTTSSPRNPELTAKQVRLFELRFDPTARGRGGRERALREEILADLDAVVLLDHDRILRNQLGLIDATVRTNAFRAGPRRDGLQAALRRRPGDPAAGAAVRDLRLRAGHGGHPPARRADRPRRPALVGPHGLPHRGLRAACARR